LRPSSINRLYVKSKTCGSCEKGKVNISEAFYELIKDDPRFSFEYRGNISAKGKGEINMYFVEKKGAS
jgi:adenylate cyclase